MYIDLPDQRTLKNLLSGDSWGFFECCFFSKEATQDKIKENCLFRGGRIDDTF